jgi:hypothetical protein
MPHIDALNESEQILFMGMFVTIIHAVLHVFSEHDVDDYLQHFLMDNSKEGLQQNVCLYLTTAALFDFRLSCSFFQRDLENSWWVKPRSTTSFTHFLYTEYDDSRWIAHFRMSKQTVLNICECLDQLVGKKNTQYRIAVSTQIRVCATLYKLAHGASFHTMSEMFAIRRSTIGLVIREVVRAINIVLKDLISWPTWKRMRNVMLEFPNFCSMPSVHGAIDCTNIAIHKPGGQYCEDYYYYKSGGYSVCAQAVVDCSKRFLDIYVGIPGSVNDTWILRNSGLFESSMRGEILQMHHGFTDGITPYLLADKRYPLINWLMIPHKDETNDPPTPLQKLYNKHHRRGRSVVENALGILKGTFRELLLQTNLHVTIIPDVFCSCALLHNLILGEKYVDVACLMRQLAIEAQYDMEQYNQ